MSDCLIRCLVAASSFDPLALQRVVNIFESRTCRCKSVFGGDFHQALGLGFQGVHGSDRRAEDLGRAVERLFEILQKRARAIVERFLGKADRAARSMVRGPRVGAHRSNSVPVYGNWITRWP